MNEKVTFAEDLTNNTDTAVNEDLATDDSALLGAKIISTESYTEGRKYITKTIYELPDGTTITDQLVVGTDFLRSANETETATRTRTIENFGTIKIKATFSWYTAGKFSYVKCTSMTATPPTKNGVVCDKWDTEYTSEYVSIGKAKAQVSYQFHLKDAPAKYVDGTFKITCTDNGTISDNG